MSLINDALQSAQAAQKKDDSAGPPPAQFQPVQPGQGGGEKPVWLIVVICLAAMIIGVVLLKAFTSKEKPMKVEAKGVTAATNASNAQNTEASAPPANRGIPPPAPKPTTYQPRTQELAVAISAPPRPVAPKLQSIIFHPTRPSAVVSGKTVLVGDTFGEFFVTRITRDSVTLVSSTQTNVLTFGP